MSGRPPRALAAARLAVLGLLALGCSGEPLSVASDVDLTRFQGEWYEIQKIPRLTESDCYGTMGFYTLHPDGSLDLVHQCHTGSLGGPLESVTMAAKVPDPATPAKLALNVGGFYGDYWILDVGPQYEYAVIGHPSRLYLWILSRGPTLDRETLQGIVSRAQGLGFDTSQLVATPQDPSSVPTGQPQGDVAPAQSYGCYAAPLAGSRRDPPAVLLATALLVAIRARRRRATTRA